METGEYLIHGRLINTGNLWKAVPLETLIEAGLWDSFPELNDRQGTGKYTDSPTIHAVEFSD